MSLSTPKWKQKDALSQKSGNRCTIYLANGARYLGSWDRNLFHGTGTLYYSVKTSGGGRNGKANGDEREWYLYQGEFQNGKKTGFGTLSIKIRQELDSEKTANGIPPSSCLKKLYAGQWYNDRKCGQGIYFFDDGVFDGNWVDDCREGWGKMTYGDGAMYIGEWFRDQRHGQGLLLCGKYLSFATCLSRLFSLLCHSFDLATTTTISFKY
jgi:hypothetical protein